MYEAAPQDSSNTGLLLSKRVLVKMESIPDYENGDFTITEPHEDMLEKATLRKFGIPSGKWAADVGSGYGRLSQFLTDNFENVILMDYSISNLKRASHERSPAGMHFVACDIRDPPIRDGILQFALLVRVLHHFRNPAYALTNISRKLKPGGEILFNFNNTTALPFIVAKIASLILRMNRNRLNVSILKRDPQEATSIGDSRPIYFASYDYIHELVRNCNLEVEKTIGIGYLHHRFIEDNSRHIKVERFIAIETLISSLPFFNIFSPDVFMKCRLKSESGQVKSEPQELLDVVVCPNCHSSLLEKLECLICDNCGCSYPIHDKIVDMRIVKSSTLGGSSRSSSAKWQRC